MSAVKFQSQPDPWRRVWIVRGRVRSGTAPEYVELCAFKVWQQAMAVLNGVAEQLAAKDNS